MATFSVLERISGVLSLLKEEFVDAQWCRNEVPPHVDLAGRVILITGATSGIGKETAKQLAMFGATVIITARDVEKGQRCVDELIDATKNPNIEYQFLDFCDFQSIEVAVEQLCARLKRLDVLINCAALGFVNSFELTKDGHEVLFQTTYLGPYLLTYRLLPLVIKSGTSVSPSRILIVGSAGHFACPTFTFEKLDDPSTVLSTQYVTSKFLNTVHGMALANQLKNENVVVHTISPGLTMTSFWDPAPWYSKRISQFVRSLSLGKSIPQAAGTVILVASSEEAAQSTGGYWANMRKVSASAKVHDEQLQQKIIEKTNQALGF